MHFGIAWGIKTKGILTKEITMKLYLTTNLSPRQTECTAFVLNAISSIAK